MAKIAYFTNGMASTLNSSLELGRQLETAGHEVAFVSHMPLGETYSTYGYPFFQLTECQRIKDQLRADLKSLGSKYSPAKILPALRLIRNARKQSLTTPEIENLVARIQPDLLIFDVEMHYAIIATRKLNIPAITTIVWFSIFRNDALPPMHTDLQPACSDLVADSALQKSKIAQAWAKLLKSRYLGNLRERFSLNWRRRAMPVGYDTLRTSSLRSVAKSRGENFANLTDWKHWLAPFVYRDLPVLSFNVSEMEFPHQPDERLSYVGPMVFEKRQETLVPEREKQAWEQFRARSTGESKPIVYCSLGTYWATDTTFLNKVIEVFRNRKDWSLVIGLGAKVTPDDFGAVPNNILLMTYAPQLEVLSSSAAAITHGGITTINECVHFGVPMLVCSTSHVDQDGCEARIVYHRLGLAADLKTATQDNLEHSLGKLLNDEEIKGNVNRMQDILLQYRNERVAMNAIESFLE